MRPVTRDRSGVWLLVVCLASAAVGACTGPAKTPEAKPSPAATAKPASAASPAPAPTPPAAPATPGAPLAAAAPAIEIPEDSKGCVECHSTTSPAIVLQWKSSAHARRGIGCLECHAAEPTDPDAWKHEGKLIATIVTPKDCASCHKEEVDQFEHSHHAKAGNILASLDNLLAETLEGSRANFSPHSPTPGHDVKEVIGMAAANSGCRQCHGAKVALVTTDGGRLTLDDFKPGADGKPANAELLSKVAHDPKTGRPVLDPATWPNTGIGRMNLDGSLGSCAACHSRHDFSARRARQPESCGKCHLGPDHPQKEIYDESKHGIAFRDLREQMNLDAPSWVLGKDYSQAPTCASCHLSGNVKNGGKITHDPGERISWTNRPMISQVMDTDKDHKVVTETDPEKRKALVADTAEQKRDRMKQACTVCHSSDYVDAFYKQYDDLVVLFNEKFGKAGKRIMDSLLEQGLRTKPDFDEEIEWTWYEIWHHQGRRARHGASMMAPDYTQWHGMYEVAQAFYTKFIPQAREIAAKAAAEGKVEQAKAVNAVIDEILARPEHAGAGAKLLEKK